MAAIRSPARSNWTDLPDLEREGGQPNWLLRTSAAARGSSDGRCDGALDTNRAVLCLVGEGSRAVNYSCARAGSANLLRRVCLRGSLIMALAVLVIGSRQLQMRMLEWKKMMEEECLGYSR